MAARAGIQAFTSQMLTEAEVARPILQGHSSKAIARMLGNSPKTNKVFGIRIHTKLWLASTGELFSLILAALCAAPHGTTDDPLIHLT